MWGTLKLSQGFCFDGLPILRLDAQRVNAAVQEYMNVVKMCVANQCFSVDAFDQNDNKLSSGKSIVAHPGSEIGHLA